MKTSVKLLNALLLSGTIFLVQGITGCNQTGNTNGESEPRTQKLAKVKPPKLDIHAAALMGDLDAIQQHIAAGTDLEQKDPIGGSTPLITACVFGNAEVANVLMEAGADLEAKNNDGSTPLHCAALFCYPDIVQSLLDHGADKMSVNNRGEHPSVAVQGTFEEMVPVYDFFNEQLGPLGFKLDYNELKKNRPVITALLK